MNSNKKLLVILIIGLPLLLIIAYVYYIFSIVGGKNSNNSKADILLGSGSNTSQSSTGDNQNMAVTISGDNQQSEKVESINVYLPDYFETSGLKAIKKDLYVNKKIKVNYIKYKNLLDYQNQILLKLARSSKDVDIIMVPTDWLDTFKEYGYKLNFKSDISQIFHFIFYDYVKAQNYTYIPFAIDPMITLVDDNSFIKGDSLSLGDVKNSILVSDSDKSQKNYYFKSLFGISNYDISLIKNNKEIYSNYFLVLYQFINISLSQKSNEYIDFFHSLSQNDDYKHRDGLKFKKIVKKLEEKYSDCSNFPNICVIARGYGNMSFGFLSDMDIYEKYFEGSAKDGVKPKIYNFVGVQDEYPVKGWGFLINKNSENLLESSIFINQYINEGNKGNSSFWHNVLSPFNTVISSQKLDKKYFSLIKYIDQMKVIYAGVSLQENLIKKTRIIDVLEGKYSMNAFLENTDLETIQKD